MEDAAAIVSRRDVYRTIAALRPDVKIWESPGSTSWTVVFEQDSRFQASCLNRFVFVKPVEDMVRLLEALDAVSGKVSTVGIAAPPPVRRELALALARWGVTRICPLGQMQDPPLTWRHDGRPALGDLVVWVDVES